MRKTGERRTHIVIWSEASFPTIWRIGNLPPGCCATHPSSRKTFCSNITIKWPSAMRVRMARQEIGVVLPMMCESLPTETWKNGEKNWTKRTLCVVEMYSLFCTTQLHRQLQDEWDCSTWVAPGWHHSSTTHLWVLIVGVSHASQYRRRKIDARTWSQDGRNFQLIHA